MNIPAGVNKSDFAYAVFMAVWSVLVALCAVFYLDFWLLVMAVCGVVFAGLIYNDTKSFKIDIALLAVMIFCGFMSRTKDLPDWPFMLLVLGYAAYQGYRIILGIQKRRTGA